MDDDVSRKRLERVEETVKLTDQRLTSLTTKVSGIETRVEQVHGLTQQFRDEMMDRLGAASEQRRAQHAEQMKAFQSVLEEVRAARDRKIAELEADVAQLKAQVAQLLARLH